jgi:hypothetical protein
MFHGHSVILPTSPPVLLRPETQRDVVIESPKADCEALRYRLTVIRGVLDPHPRGRYV